MRCLFLISLFFVLSSGVEDQTVKAVIKKPRMFASVLSKIDPGQSAQTAKDVQSLIDTGEEERVVAQAAIDEAQKALDVAKTALDAATGARAAMETTIEGKESDQDRLNALKASQQALLSEADEEDRAATQLVAIEQENLKLENERIDSEKAIFQKVIDMLKNLGQEDAVDAGGNGEEGDEFEDNYDPDSQAGGNDADFEGEGADLAQVDSVHYQKLVPSSMMSIVNSADPENVQKLITLLENVITDGEVKRGVAQKAYDDAVERARLADEDLGQKQTDLTKTDGDLADVATKISECQTQLANLVIAEGLADAEHTDKLKIWEGKNTIYLAEIARIDSELNTFREAIADLLKLEDVVSLLA